MPSPFITARLARWLKLSSSARTPKSISIKLLLNQSSPSFDLSLEFFHPHLGLGHFPSLNFLTLLSATFPSLSLQKFAVEHCSLSSTSPARCWTAPALPLEKHLVLCWTLYHWAQPSDADSAVSSYPWAHIRVPQVPHEIAPAAEGKLCLLSLSERKPAGRTAGKNDQATKFLNLEIILKWDFCFVIKIT